MQINQLLRVPPSQHDRAWLQESLQWAIRLELATIPVYLTGMWSIQNPQDDVRRYITDIVTEEMLHMGWACNMLTTIGGSPVFNTPATAPKYPGSLPGGVRPELRLWLAGLSRGMVRAVYMEIETPDHKPIGTFLRQDYPTIGAFYKSIKAAFQQLPASQITGARQLSHLKVGLSPITTKAEACDAIDIIMEQGEGTAAEPFPTSNPSSRAHYYRFAEIYYGRRLEQANGVWGYTGDVVEFPRTFPMAEVPAAGYAESRCFDMAYTRILDDLQLAWARGDECLLHNSVAHMRLLEEPARDLMQRPLPSGEGVFGPSFKLVR